MSTSSLTYRYAKNAVKQRNSEELLEILEHVTDVQTKVRILKEGGSEFHRRRFSIYKKRDSIRRPLDWPLPRSGTAMGYPWQEKRRIAKWKQGSFFSRPGVTTYMATILAFRKVGLTL